MRARCLLLLLLVLLTFVGTALPGPGVRAAPAESPRWACSHPVRGMTISCRGSGRSWGSDEMVATMALLAASGVEWIAIHPYAGIAPDGTVGGRMQRMYADPSWLTRPIAEAHRLGLEVMVKPHIAYWGSPFSWRGAITFNEQAQWERFFETYEQWIVHVATLARDADAFVVGTELDRTLGHDAQWRTIIAAVRASTDAHLTYAANWDAWTQVPFWDALDAIGIQAYFPLTGEANAPDAGALADSWSRHMAHIEREARRHDRPVVFTELGYDATPNAAREPWKGGPRRGTTPESRALQAACLDAALRAIDESPAVCGAMLWKWFPGETRSGDFLMSESGPRAVIERNWGQASEK